MLKLSRPLALLLTAAAVLPLVGCAHGKGATDTAYVARDVSSLYTAAKKSMDQGDYEQSAKLFDEVERQHPYSVWARHAQLMSAFNYYLARKYTDAVSSAQRFVTIHPGNAEAPYAQYLIAMSYYQQIDDVNRDQTNTQQAQDAFNDLIRRYPDSRYAADARIKLDLIKDHLAGKEMEVGRFYQRSGPVARRDLPFPRGGRSIPDHKRHSGGARAAGRMLSRARHPAGGAEGGRGAWPQLPRVLLVQAIAEAAWAGEQAGQPAGWLAEGLNLPAALAC